MFIINVAPRPFPNVFLGYSMLIARWPVAIDVHNHGISTAGVFTIKQKIQLELVPSAENLLQKKEGSQAVTYSRVQGYCRRRKDLKNHAS